MSDRGFGGLRRPAAAMPCYCLAMLLPGPAMLLLGPAMLLPGPAHDFLNIFLGKRRLRQSIDDQFYMIV